MFYYTYLEFHNCHEMHMLSLMNKIEVLAVLHGLFCRKAKLPVPQIISNSALSYALGFKRFRCLLLSESLMIFVYL